MQRQPPFVAYFCLADILHVGRHEHWNRHFRRAGYVDCERSRRRDFRMRNCSVGVDKRRADVGFVRARECFRYSHHKRGAGECGLRCR